MSCEPRFHFLLTRLRSSCLSAASVDLSPVLLVQQPVQEPMRSSAYMLFLESGHVLVVGVMEAVGVSQVVGAVGFGFVCDVLWVVGSMLAVSTGVGCRSPSGLEMSEGIACPEGAAQDRHRHRLNTPGQSTTTSLRIDRSKQPQSIPKCVSACRRVCVF